MEINKCLIATSKENNSQHHDIVGRPTNSPFLEYTICGKLQRVLFVTLQPFNKKHHESKEQSPFPIKVRIVKSRRGEHLGKIVPSLTYAFCPADEKKLSDLLLYSRRTYEKYTAPLGIGWMVNPHEHYGPNPSGYEYDMWGTYRLKAEKIDASESFGVEMSIHELDNAICVASDIVEHLLYEIKQEEI